MSQRLVSPHIVALAAILGGCAGPMGPIRSEPPPAPPVTSFDGSYRTAIRSVDTPATKGTVWCDSPGQEVVTVANGRFSFAVPHPDVPGNPPWAARSVPSMSGQPTHRTHPVYARWWSPWLSGTRRDRAGCSTRQM